MSDYKTLDEWFRNTDGKPDGRKFANAAKGPDYWFQPYFKSSVGWYGLDSKGGAERWDEAFGFAEYIPPKKTKKVTMYRPIRLAPTGGHYWIHDWWHSRKSKFDGDDIVGWMEQEVEVEDN